MKKNITISVIAVGLVAAVSVWYFFFSNGKNSEVQYRLEKVSRGDIQVVVTATGTLSAVTTVQVGSQVSGILSKINVDFNDKVKKNQVVAQIDPTFLAASVRDAEASLQRAVAQYNESQRSFQRTKSLLEKSLASQADYDVALSQYEGNDAARKQAEAQLERAKINLRYATIISPIDGVVISRAVDVGQTVAASFSAPTLFTIANDLTKMQVQASVDEADIGKVQDGQDVTFTVDAYPEQTFHGTVRQVRLAPKLDQNVVNYTVIIDVPNPELKLMPGMTATVTVLVTKKESVLKVPTIALRFTPSSDQIEVRKDSTGTNSNDSTRNERRRQFAERMRQSGTDGGNNSESMQQRMASRGVARVWILNEKKKLEPIFVRTGLNDGTFTEIVRGKVDEGQEIVVGALTQRLTNGSQTSSPFGSQNRNAGGGPRRF
ncbi:MAG: efflux RND transporter periplasmic adaptor subunit [Bacteroidota bacterium]|nr:efflux RND transporter periplasmic adaptor subunit [Bacteroidota bacterium]